MIFAEIEESKEQIVNSYMEQSKYYRHFKGGKYELLAIALNSETQEKEVVYRALYGEHQVWVRPYDMFFSKVDCDGRLVERFKQISAQEALESID